MSRTSLTAAFITEITKYAPNHLAPVILLDANFDSGNLRLWNGIGDITYNSNTYTGAGTILDITGVKETKGITADGMQATLNGLDITITDLAENEPYQNREFYMYLGMLDSSGAIIADPYLMFEGFMYTMKMVDTGKTISVAVSIENSLLALERARDSKYTPEDQKREFPNDTGLDHIAGIQNKEVVWG